jgi:hypothetical protein
MMSCKNALLKIEKEEGRLWELWDLRYKRLGLVASNISECL